MSLDISALGLRTAEPQTASQAKSVGRGAESLGQQDFLTLLVTQLKNQDPLNPLDNEAFVAQLAQFSTVSGITEMNTSLKALTASAAGDGRSSAPQWIGRKVSTADGVTGTVKTIGFAPDGSLTLNLEDGTGLPLASIASVA